MAALDAALTIGVLLFIAFIVYIRITNQTAGDVIREIKEAFKNKK